MGICIVLAEIPIRCALSTKFRCLHASEYDKLRDIQDGYVPDPANSIALVGERNGDIAARMLLIRPWHIEGTWIREDARNGFILAGLMSRMQNEAKARGITNLLSFAPNEEVEHYLGRLGFKRQPISVWSKEI